MKKVRTRRKRKKRTGSNKKEIGGLSPSDSKSSAFSPRSSISPRNSQNVVPDIVGKSEIGSPRNQEIETAATDTRPAESPPNSKSLNPKTSVRNLGHGNLAPPTDSKRSSPKQSPRNSKTSPRNSKTSPRNSKHSPRNSAYSSSARSSKITCSARSSVATAATAASAASERLEEKYQGCHLSTHLHFLPPNEMTVCPARARDHFIFISSFTNDSLGLSPRATQTEPARSS